MSFLQMRDSMRNVLSSIAILIFTTTASLANELQNGDFEGDVVAQYGNHIGFAPTGWSFGPGQQPNLVKVDGPGNYDYGNAGPEEDATGGNRTEQHYLDIAGGENSFFQSFQASCDGQVQFGGSFSTRANSAASVSLSIVEGSLPSGNTVANSPVTSLPGGQSKTDPWTDVSGTASLTANQSYTFVVYMDNNANFDNGFVEFELDCKEDGGTGINPCCPPWNEQALQESLVMVPTGSLADPYLIEFQPSAQLDAQMQAYIDYLDAIGACSNLVLSFTASDFQGNPPLQGTPPGHTDWYIPGSQRWVKWTADQPGASYSPFYGSSIQFQVVTWYRIGTGMYCEPEKSYFGDECAVSYVDFRVQVLGSNERRTGGGAAPIVLQVRSSDGKISSRPMQSNAGSRVSIWNALRGNRTR